MMRGLWVAVLAAGCAMAQALPDLARLKTYSAERVSSANRFTGSNDDSKRIMPGETFVISDLQGPGVVTHIWLTVADNEFAWPRLARLRVYYDGKKTPSVDAPLGDFFGVGHGYDRNLESAVIRNSSFGRARNSYWPMPFRESCRITITDEGDRPIPMFYYHVDWQKHRSLPDDTAYFHAYYRQERPAAAGRHYEFLNIKGTGHYVGTVLNVIQSQVGWFGEGDDFFYVDGADKPQIVGTGTEDYVNEAWGLRVSTGAWAGTPVAEGEMVGARLTGYRWHIPDPIPFATSLRAGIEHAGWTYNPDGAVRSGFEERPDYYSSVAFWYQKGVNEGLPEPPYGKARLPLGNAEQIAVEDSLADVKTVKGKASVQKEVDWGRDLLFFEGEEKGARIDVPIEVRAAGRYEILARLAQAPDYGDYVALLDGKAPNVDKRQAATSEVPTSGMPVFHGYAPEVYVAMETPLGWVTLTQGRHTLSFVCVGKDSRSAGHFLGINDVVLERVPERRAAASGERAPAATAEGSGPVYRSATLDSYVRELTTGVTPGVLRAIGAFGADAAPAAAQVARMLGSSEPEMRGAAAWALAQMGPAGWPGLEGLERALGDEDARVRSTAAVALRSMGAEAAPAMAGLIRALEDREPYVRAVAADALGNLGTKAKAAVPALAKHVTAPESTVYVMRSAATALGSIGPDAKDALPALEKALGMYRVTYAAEEAIRRIRGEKVEEWR